MQRALATDIDHNRGLRAMPILFVALSLSLLLALAPAASAQESTPAASTPAAAAEETVDVEPNALGEVLMQREVDEMPQAPMTVRMLRITLEPGANVPMHNHPGIELDYIESGTLTVRTDGTIIVSTGEEATETTESQSLSAGSWVMFPSGTGMNLVNEGDENVVLLSAVVLSVGNEVESTITYTEGEPTDADFQGVSFEVLGDGLIQQFPNGGATVTVDRLTVDASAPVPGYSGVAMLSKESGEMAFAATEGAVQVTRTASPQLQPNAIPGQEFELNDNDAAFFPAGYEAIQRDGGDEVSLLRLLIMPEGDLANTAAVVTALGSGETATETEISGDGIGVGAIVALNIDDVNIRADATTTSDIVGTYPAGTQFELTDGPVEGEDYTWYAVQGVGDLADVQGWLVTDFMDVIEPATGEAQPDGDGSGGTEDEGTPTADTADGEIAVGATVQLNEDLVRIREEPNTGGAIINTFDAGTQMTVLDGPVEADGFTWYQVEITDAGVSGWTAADFLEVVE